MRVDKSKWRKFKIADVFRLEMGKTPSRKELSLWENGTIPWVSISDMGQSDNIKCTKEMLSLDTITKCNIPIVPVGVVIMSFKLSIGKTAIADTPLTTNEAIMAFYPKETNFIFNRFLLYLLRNLNWKGNRAVKGITINKKIISKKSILIPPYSEQQGIASELDAIQEVIDGYKAQLADLDALAQSIFLDMFGDPITNPKGWKMNKVSDLSMKMSTGPFGSMLHKSDYTVDGIPSINPQNINNRKIITDDIAKISYQKAEELSKYIVRTNNIIIARRGDLSKCAIITDKEDGWLCGTGSFMLELKNILPILFYYQYTSQSVQKFLNDKCIGATMPNLNQKILGGLKLIVPPLSLQQHFASQVEAIEKQKNLLREQLKDAETLMAERMQYYFS